MAVERLSYKGWSDALRLTNGTVEAVIVPSVGRLMRFGFVGGPNLLWENKAVAGKPIKLGEWANTGGDKVWVWPQDDWPNRMPNAWPPPAALDQAPHQAEILSEYCIRLTSSLVIGWGLRCQRQLSLVSNSTTLFMANVLRKVRDGADFPVAPWTVTQVGAAPTIWVRKRDGTLQRHMRDPKNSTKTFFDAHVLAHVQGDTLLTVRSRLEHGDAGDGYATPTDRAQVYCNADDPWFGQNGMTSYTELEFTAPLKTLKRGESNILGTTLTLDKIDPRHPLEPQLLSMIH
jgi:hypothetical protein